MVKGPAQYKYLIRPRLSVLLLLVSKNIINVYKETICIDI